VKLKTCIAAVVMPLIYPASVYASPWQGTYESVQDKPNGPVRKLIITDEKGACHLTLTVEQSAELNQPQRQMSIEAKANAYGEQIQERRGYPDRHMPQGAVQATYCDKAWPTLEVEPELQAAL
jgi:hypothetical protein